MPRYRIDIEYDGTPFCGWQVQAEGPSVQGALEVAIEKYTGEKVRPRGAGRTDSGVHALRQTAHFDLAKPREPYVIREAINHMLKPAPVVVLEVREVADTFDARFSALRRHYIYRILNRRAPPALARNKVWWLARPLDAAAMADAAPVLVGLHDFTTFRAAGCQAKSPVKSLDRLAVTLVGEEIVIETNARSFMHSQVRSLVGSLKLVGEGKWSKADLAAALEAKDRTACGPVAPSRGLYFARADYPDDV